MKRIAMVLASLTLSGGLALAQTPEKVAEHWFNQGNTAYNLGRYEDAANNFTKAYEAWPQPEFLYNIAQSYRLGGNCKQALHFYKRFKSLKEADSQSPLSPKRRDEVDKFISELTECAAKTATTAGRKPDTIDKPPPGGTGTTGTTTDTGTTTTGTTGATTGTGTTTTGTTGTPTGTGTTTTGRLRAPVAGTTATTAATTTTAALEDPDEEIDEEVDDETSVRARTTGPTLLSARMTAGVALLGSGDLEIPVQPSVGLTAGYPLALGSMTLEVGAGFAWSPLPYENAEGQQQGRMIAARAVGALVVPATPKILLRGELGAGVVSLSGLRDGNPISDMRDAGGFTLPSFRFGVSADFVITPSLVAYVSPFGIAFSPGNERMYGGSLREIDILVGVGYRQ